MCEQCVARTNSWGEILPGFALLRATAEGDQMSKGNWGLVQCNDPDFVWGMTPKPNPFYGVDDAALDENQQEILSAWEDQVQQFMDACCTNEHLVVDWEGATMDSNGDPDLPRFFLTPVVKLMLAIQALGGPIVAQKWGFEDVGDGRTNVVSAFEWLYHYLALYIEQNPEPIYRDNDDEGYSLHDLRDQINKLFGLPYGGYGFSVDSEPDQEWAHLSSAEKPHRYELQLGKCKNLAKIWCWPPAKNADEEDEGRGYRYRIVSGLGANQEKDLTVVELAAQIRLAWLERYPEAVHHNDEEAP